MRRDGSCGNLIRPATSLASLRKCETVLTLTNVLRSSSSSSSMEPLQPVNRLRLSPPTSLSRTCSRCSSLLTLASSSRYSLNTSTGGFVPVPDGPPLLCKLCLAEVPLKDACPIQQCNCSFCTEVSCNWCSSYGYDYTVYLKGLCKLMYKMFRINRTLKVLWVLKIILIWNFVCNGSCSISVIPEVDIYFVILNIDVHVYVRWFIWVLY